MTRIAMTIAKIGPVDEKLGHRSGS